MYRLLANFFKKINFVFKTLQVLFLIYFLLYIFYWFCEVGRFSLAYFFAPIYEIPYQFTKNIISHFGWNIGTHYPMLRTDILLSIFFVFIAMIIYNFIFFPIERIETFFVNKFYEKRETDFK